jgi:hypothetical protein
MRHLLPIAVLVSAVAAIPATAASVRTLAFDLPATPVTFELSSAEAAAGSSTAKLRIEARKSQFSERLSLPSGRYVASSSAFSASAQFTLPEAGGGRFLLLILPRPDGGCSILPIADDTAKIGPGDRFLINATGEEIAVRLGTQRANLKPGHSVLLRPPPPPPDDPRIEVEMARLVANEWVPFNSTYWPLDPAARSFVLIHPDPVTGTPRVRNLSEIPQATPPSP